MVKEAETKISFEDILPQQREKVLRFVLDQLEDSRQNEKEPRSEQVKKNWNYYHGKIDWSHKGDGDAKIHLHKVGVAAERHRAKFKSNLMKYDKWMSVELLPGYGERTITSYFAKNITIRHLDRAKGKTKFSDAILLGEMEGRSALKVSWQKRVTPKFVARGTELRKVDSKKGQLVIETKNFDQLHVDQHNPDCPLFIMEEVMADFHEVYALSSDEPTPEKPFYRDVVEKLGNFEMSEQQMKKAEREGKDTISLTTKSRKLVSIINFWGTVLGEDGKILEWQTKSGDKIELENVFLTIGNECELIRDPLKIPRWSGKAPIVYADLLRAPGQGIKAIMDAGTSLNQAENELTNAIIDGSLREAHNLTWYRRSWIADKKKASGGFRYGDSVPINDDMPINGTPMGTLESGKVPQGALQVLQSIVKPAFAENVFTNQLDLSGNMPSKQVRATEVVTANEAIGDIFDSLAQDVEEELIEPFLLECFLEIMQNSKDLSEEEILAAYGPGAELLAQQFMKMTPQERFAEAANSFRFVAKGLRGQISSATRAQAALNLLNTLTANPITAQKIESTISIAKLSSLIIKGMGFDMEEVTTDPTEKWFIMMKQLIAEKAMMEQAQAEQAQMAQQGQVQPSQGTQPAVQEQPGPQQGM